MKTAMQQLIDFLEPEIKMHDFLQLPAFEKAKELLEVEKQQIIEAVDTKGVLIDDDHNFNEITGIKYYNETFETFNQ